MHHSTLLGLYSVHLIECLYILMKKSEKMNKVLSV